MLPLSVQVVFLVLLIVLPLVSRWVEHNLEFFFLVLALTGATLAGVWGWDLAWVAFVHAVAVYQPGVGYVPVGITQVVLGAGLFFYYLRRRLARWGAYLARPGLLAAFIFLFGLLSSVISAVVAAAVLAELLGFAKAPHAYKARAAVYGAFSIGVGAALLPLGEPLSTIAVAKLRQGFFYLVDVLFDVVLVTVLIFSLYSYFTLRSIRVSDVEIESYEPELREVFLRTARIFVFVLALTILGEFFKPLAQAAAGLGREALYVFGLMSAVADNATLVAALVNKDIAVVSLRSFIVSIVISGGFTIPGNAPNIVLANVLKISFREWMKLALPIGIVIFIAAGVYVLWLAPYPLL